MDTIRKICSPFKSARSKRDDGAEQLTPKRAMADNRKNGRKCDMDDKSGDEYSPKVPSRAISHRASISSSIGGFIANRHARTLSPTRSMKTNHSMIITSPGMDGVKLTPHQRDLVRDAWHNANRKKGDAGVWIFKWLFSNYPYLKEMFGLQDVEDCDLDTNQKLLHHAKVFSDVLEMIVDSADALDDSMGPLLVSYGSKHVLFEERCGFKPEYWDIFAFAMCEYAAKSWKITSQHETIHAWRMLVSFVISKVKEGFYLEKNICKAKERSPKK